jgi:hypothetical protein
MRTRVVGQDARAGYDFGAFGVAFTFDVSSTPSKDFLKSRILLPNTADLREFARPEDHQCDDQNNDQLWHA